MQREYFDILQKLVLEKRNPVKDSSQQTICQEVRTEKSSETPYVKSEVLLNLNIFSETLSKTITVTINFTENAETH